jgi:hypothetical protein
MQFCTLTLQKAKETDALKKSAAQAEKAVRRTRKKEEGVR